eukprot:jgi/Mesen1/1725/ME000138S00575
MTSRITLSGSRVAGTVILIGVLLNVLLATLVLYTLQFDVVGALERSAKETRLLAEHLAAQQQLFMQQQAPQAQPAEQAQRRAGPFNPQRRVVVDQNRWPKVSKTGAGTSRPTTCT